MIDHFTFYDLETTGLKVRFDVPIQFASVRTDGDLRLIREVEFRGRPPMYVLPAPGALAITGLTVSSVFGVPLSFNSLMSRIAAEILEAPASCYCAFNGLRFDEEMLRHSFYQSLRQPYLTQLNGNTRADSMKLAQAVHILQPDRLVVPEDSAGKRTFKLQLLAAANGISGYRAHDAMGDVRATLELMRLLRSKARETWQFLSLWTDKWAVEELLSICPVVLSAEWLGRWGKPSLKSLHPIRANPTYPTEWALINLALDPTSYLNMSAQELFRTMKSRSGPKPIVRIKANAMPILLPGDHVLARDRHPVDSETCASRTRQIDAHADFYERVEQAMVMYRESFEEPVYVEDQLYSGGFFPLEQDSVLMELFHSAPLGDKPAIVARMKDPRARELGRRLILNEWPDALSADERQGIQHVVTERLTTEDAVPWITVQKALDEIARLRDTCDGNAPSILEEYELYLLGHWANPVAAESKSGA